MKRKLKSILYLVCSFSILFTNITNIYANNDNKIIQTENNIKTEVLVDNNDEVKVKSIEDDKIIISRVDKKSSIMTIEKYTLDNQKLLSKETLNLNKISSEASENNLSKANYQNTISNREYRYYYDYDSKLGRCKKWDIKSDYMTKNGIVETTDNINNLINFKNTVENINAKEISLAINSSIGVVSTILISLATGGLSAGIVAIAAICVTSKIVIKLNRAINDADFYFYRIN